jgi:DNA helicase HerA-like ATPase
MLSIDTENKLQLEPADLIGRRIAVLGISGSGKTNTAAVLIEEMYTAGFPFTIVDIEGEYWGLREQLNVLIIGRKGKKNVIDVEVTPEQASEFARASLEKKISVVLDLSEFSPSEQKEFLFQYVQTLFDLCANSLTS